MKKTIFTLEVDGYAPEIVKLTRPTLEHYAEKVGAQLHVITGRQWPGHAPVYEKLQIFRLAQEMDTDWVMYFDADALIHPETPDLTLLVPADHVANIRHDWAPHRWAYRDDRFFLRDGRHIGCGNWLAVGSRLVIDYWRPLEDGDLTYADAVKRIYPTGPETRAGITPAHLVDDFVCSRNVAKFGLKYTGIDRLMESVGHPHAPGEYFFHEYLQPTSEKVKHMQATLDRWAGKTPPAPVPPTEAPPGTIT